MYGGGRSFKRGGAVANRRHYSFPPPSDHPSLGGSAGRNVPRGKAKIAAATPPSAEETFSLVSGDNSPAFSMIIKLTPSLVEEIKRAEAEGMRARIKFDSNPYNSSGNVIEVGGKEFRFIWLSEFGDLCDIYEERQSGEDGNGLLVEFGCAWRKLNIQRVLDESITNHVKMRSEEAERNLKSRRAIVLEPGNPFMYSQKKALAAVEGSSATLQKNYNKKKEAAPKKRNVGNFQVGGPPKSTYKLGSSSKTATEGKHSFPLSSQSDQPVASSSPLGAENVSKSIDDALPSQMIGKQDRNASYEKGIHDMKFNAMRDTPGHKGNNIAKSIDLQSMLIYFLKNKPNGLTLKALVKAVQGIVPNPLRKIKLILGNIARYKSPGRYILLPGVDFESLNKPQAKSGSSPDDNHGQKPALQEFGDRSVPLGGFKEKVPNIGLEERMQLNSNVEEESNTLENIKAQHASPYIFGGGFDHGKGEGGSTSDGESGSDSENDGSDGGSDTGSQSSSSTRTGSGSSGDGKSDASFNSKERLDEDVDIMISDEEIESKHKTKASDRKVPLTILVRSLAGRSLQNETDEEQDNNETNEVEIEKDLPEEQEAEMALNTATFSNISGKAVENMPFPGYKRLWERQNYIRSLFIERENRVKRSSRHGQSDKSAILFKRKRKMDSNAKNVDDISERMRRLKAENLRQAQGSPGMDVQVRESTQNFNRIGLESLDKSRVIDQRGTSLQRDVSDSELGKLVNSTPDEAQLERKITFKQAKNSVSIASEKGKLKAVNAEMEFLNTMSERNYEFRETGKSKAINAELEFLNTLTERNYGTNDNEFGVNRDVELEFFNENNTRVDRGKDSSGVDRNNGDKKRESSSDENGSRYLKYEKDQPVLKGRILTFAQYKEYAQDYNEKYEDYSSLNNFLTNYRNEFQQLCNQIEDAKKNKDVDRYTYILGQIKESYERHGVMHKRLKKVFVVLHEELEHQKQMITDYVNSSDNLRFVTK